MTGSTPSGRSRSVSSAKHAGWCSGCRGELTNETSIALGRCLWCRPWFNADGTIISATATHPAQSEDHPNPEGDA